LPSRRPHRPAAHPVALLARHTADAVEHTVLSEQIDEPLDVQDITLRQVVRAAHERFGVGCHCDLHPARVTVKGHIGVAGVDGVGPGDVAGAVLLDAPLPSAMDIEVAAEFPAQCQPLRGRTSWWVIHAGSRWWEDSVPRCHASGQLT